MKESRFFDWVGKLARVHTKMLIGIAQKEGLTSYEALDAVQEALHTFLLLPQARSLAEDEVDSAKLLSAVTRNAARNFRRRHYRSQNHIDISTTSLSDGAPTVEQLIEKAEDHIRLLGCVQALGKLQKEVVTLRILEEVSAVQVAKDLGLKVNNVNVLLHRAKQRIEECFLG